ncbi:MAG: hypothetical protein ACOC5T_07140 [Elusimicrobiota bacterium]
MKKELKKREQEVINELGDKFCVMFERAGRDNGESGDEWQKKVENFLQTKLSEVKQAERERIIKIIEGINPTIHMPVGGFSNVEWIKKRDLIKTLKETQ